MIDKAGLTLFQKAFGNEIRAFELPSCPMRINLPILDQTHEESPGFEETQHLVFELDLFRGHIEEFDFLLL